MRLLINNSGAVYNPANPATALNAVNFAYTTASYGPPRTYGLVFETNF